MDFDAELNFASNFMNTFSSNFAICLPNLFSFNPPSYFCHFSPIPSFLDFCVVAQDLSL